MRPDLIRNLLEATSDFQSRNLWQRFSNEDCFVVRIPGRGESMLGTVMGEGKTAFGLSFFRGDDAAAHLASMLAPEGPGDDLASETDMLGFSMIPFGELGPDAQALFREVGVHPRYTDEVPCFIAKRPGRRPRLPDESELSLLLTALRGTVEADRQQWLEPTPFEEGAAVCTLVLTGDAAAPQVSVHRERLQVTEAGPTAPVAIDPSDVSGLPRINATWAVGLPTFPGTIQDDDRSLHMLLVADEERERCLAATPVFADDVHEAAAALMDVFHGKSLDGGKGLPRIIRFSSRRLRDAVAPVLRQAGVTCLYRPAIPLLQAIADHFREEGEGGFLLPDEAPEPADDLAVPPPEDLAGWKKADRRLARRFAALLESDSRLRGPRAVKRYFGEDRLDDFFLKHSPQGVAMAYAAWGVLDYRPTRKSRTRAEEMLAEALPEAEARLLRARMEAHPSLYRVAECDPPAGTVTMEDVLLGETVTVHDQLMSENVRKDVFVAARPFPAGRFHFYEAAGPPLAPVMGLEAVEFLQDLGLEFTPDALRRDAHLLGRLWAWEDEWYDNRAPTRLSNTDGHSLLWHTASFHATDPAAAHQALHNRPDVTYDDANDEFVWTRAAGPEARKLGGPVTLGRIECIGDELVLTVNSAERLETARGWLETLPGVVFRDVTTRQWNEPVEDRPPDDRISEPEPVEITPELAASLQEMMNQYYMNWLDEPLPILGGKTPRQTCETPAGRQQVTMLIRTMSDPMGPEAVYVPRQAMLRALGLPSDRSAEPAPRPPARRSAARPGGNAAGFKTGRNEPCPCGSGKKFKKCCGRRT